METDIHTKGDYSPATESGNICEASGDIVKNGDIITDALQRCQKCNGDAHDNQNSSDIHSECIIIRHAVFNITVNIAN